MKLQVFDPALTAGESGEMDFRHLGDFDAGGAGVFWSGPGGRSPWEMHPNCDELLDVVEGKIEIEVLPNDGSAAAFATVRAGSFLFVPRGCWHRQYIRELSTQFYSTPGEAMHCAVEGPRIDAWHQVKADRGNCHRACLRSPCVGTDWRMNLV